MKILDLILNYIMNLKLKTFIIVVCVFFVAILVSIMEIENSRLNANLEQKVIEALHHNYRILNDLEYRITLLEINIKELRKDHLKLSNHFHIEERESTNEGGN